MKQKEENINELAIYFNGEILKYNYDIEYKTENNEESERNSLVYISSYINGKNTEEK